jgi:hypothetical protein
MTSPYVSIQPVRSCSNAMLHLGQRPGVKDRTSGCMRHV